MDDDRDESDSEVDETMQDAEEDEDMMYNEDNNEETTAEDAQNETIHENGFKKLSEVPSLLQPRPEIFSANTYDIVPTIAAPQSTSINAVASSADSRWVFTGGTDGYIRQFNWVETVNFKTPLTVAQRHPFVESVQKAGVMLTYWENWDAKRHEINDRLVTRRDMLSPVYSLACQSQALWLLSGTASGAIRLQSIRHEEGHEIAVLSGHVSAVSCLCLSSDEQSLLSGSWDKKVIDWDLGTGQIRREFALSGGQISSIESRPTSTLPVPYESGDPIKTNGNAREMNRDSTFVNGTQDDKADKTDTRSLSGTDDGDDDDLFGENAGGLDNGNVFGFDESEDINRTAEDMPILENGGGPNLDVGLIAAPTAQTSDDQPQLQSEANQTDVPIANGTANTDIQPLANNLPQAEEIPIATQYEEEQSALTPSSDSVFLATSIDGGIRIWDRRQQNPIARIVPHDTPPWCLSACWSPDGNNIYAGRREHTVQEYDLRKGLKQASRTFRFPGGSGSVTAVKAMPNGQHLICASYDILRLYDLKHDDTRRGKGSVPFLIIPGHRTGAISHLHLSKDCRYLMSTGGNRGWDGAATEVLLGYEIFVPPST